MPDDHEILPPSELIQRLSVALIQISRGDPIVALRNELDVRFGAVDGRLAAMDKATDLQHQDMVRVPTLLQSAIKDVRELLAQELKTEVAILRGELDRMLAETTATFATVNLRFVEWEKRSRDLDEARALALAAALQAAKEAVTEQNRSNNTAIAKSEASFSEQIKQMQTTSEAANRATNEKIDDIKSRLDRGEAGIAGAQHSTTERRLDAGTIMGFLALIGVFLSIVIQFFYNK